MDLWLFFRMFGVITASMAAGYLARRLGVKEVVAKYLMTATAVLGYTSVGFFAIWGTEIKAQDALLPLWAATLVIIMSMLGLGVGRLITRDRQEIGLFGITSGVGNNGATMGGFVIFLLYGKEALGLSSIYCLSFTSMMVLVLFPIARHYAGHEPPASLGRLMLRSLLDWRAAGLLFQVAAIILSTTGVPQPGFVEETPLIDVLVYAVNATAYFSIGLRLRVNYVGKLLRMITGLAVMRFGVSLLVATGMLMLVRLSPLALPGLRENVVLIQAMVPTAVTNVAVANMFDLRPREASVLFVVNTLTYLVVVLPIVFWVFG